MPGIEQQLSMKTTVFWIVTPCSSEKVRLFGRSKNKPCKKSAEAGEKLSHSTIKISYSETSGFLRNVRRYNPEIHTLHGYFCRDLKPNGCPAQIHSSYWMSYFG
jgi:hypothetical protein